MLFLFGCAGIPGELFLVVIVLIPFIPISMYPTCLTKMEEEGRGDGGR